MRETFKLSRDPRFLEKLTDVVGLYLNPPQHALVLCVDEKSQIQALDRTQPGLPLKKGRCGTMTHDYKRHGTTTLFAALDVLQGKVIGQCYARHRHQEFVRFLRRLDHEFPGQTPLHLVLDNYGTHNHPTVKAWLHRHPRFVPHFVPTSASWLNLVERWFGELTSKRIRRDSFQSVDDLIAAIEEFLAVWNENLKWTPIFGPAAKVVFEPAPTADGGADTMKKTRTKHSPAFKAKVALAALRDQESVAEIARRYKVHANVVYKWKRQLLDNAAQSFETDHSDGGASDREDVLLKKIGELTVERDFLSNGLGRSR